MLLCYIFGLPSASVTWPYAIMALLTSLVTIAWTIGLYVAFRVPVNLTRGMLCGIYAR